MTKLDRIEVLWELDNGRSVWWEAKVSHLNEKPDKNWKDAAASLQYVAGHGHGETNAHVLFQNNHTLKHLEDGKEVTLSWRPRSRPKKTFCNTKSDTRSNKRIEGLVKDVNSLRSRLVENGVEITEMKKLVELAHPALQRFIANQEDRVQTLITGLTYRLALQLQKTPRKRSGSRASNRDPYYQNVDGLNKGFVRATVDCDMRLFESFARFVNNSTSGRNQDVHFIPCYSLTQCPDQGAQSFRIFLSNFSVVCRVLGVLSLSDRLRMILKHGKFHGKGISRLLGTYSYNCNDVNDLAGIHVGQGYRPNHMDIVEGIGNPQSRYPVLLRDTRIWNTDDRKYIHPLRLKWTTRVPICREKNFESFSEFFHITWRRAPDVKRRTWSSELEYPKHVFGRLEVFLPSILVAGNVLREELTSILTQSALIQTVE